MITVGRLCMKMAGRDAGKVCVVVDVLDKNFVLVDGQTRRRKVNISHLEPLRRELEIEKGADNATVSAALKKLGYEVTAKKAKQKKVKQVAKRVHKATKKVVKPVPKTK